MRNIPRQARIAIITLYCRYREEREKATNTKKPYKQACLDKQTAIWYDLQAVKYAVSVNSPPRDPKAFIEMVKLKSRVM